jgi:hypothetical protein
MDLRPAHSSGSLGSGLLTLAGGETGARLPSTPFPAQLPAAPAAEGGAGSLAGGARAMSSGGAASSLPAGPG